MRRVASCLLVLLGLLLRAVLGGAVGFFVFILTMGGEDPLFAIGHVFGFALVGTLAGGFIVYWRTAVR